MFDKCDFLLGDNYAVIIAIPAHLPWAETYTVSVSENDIKFKAGHEDIVQFPYKGAEVFDHIKHNTQVGLLEYTPGVEYPGCITNMAYVEIRRAV